LRWFSASRASIQKGLSNCHRNPVTVIPSSRYSRYGVSTSSIHFMNARTRRDRLLRCATTRDTASARRRKSGMISEVDPGFGTSR
jgi:hypothetical protein